MLENQVAKSRFSSVEDITESISKKLGEFEPIDEKPAQKSKGAKTRFLGFRKSAKLEGDEQLEGEDSNVAASTDLCPLARLDIVAGPGQGRSLSVTESFNRIGRAEVQEIQLAFGDNTISRESHATIVYYGEGNGFVLRDGLRVNPVLLNNCTIRGDEPLKSGDQIRIGETTLRIKLYR